ncbi:hypothetical protein GYMLUDRAFT_242070 [Collybiopsis luxurians FD-317 M1]|uniref:Terpenoid synthase n=1 Tax=Collybiopsis luxurians FD-317 M1 TaxID=944289 RepID=A0A0D0CJM3_9AGAR|nr:hypothetical protein GYMLUDRAFT_242070 [Collybiopsis luxurians FD-317 M1]
MQSTSITKEEISSAIQYFLSRCSIPYRKVPMDLSLLELCYNEAEKRGYVTESSQELRSCIPGGVVIAATTYGYLEDTSAKVWIALLTAAAIYSDDKGQKDTSPATVFSERLLCGQPQEDHALDVLADLLKEAPRIFPRITANFMVVSMLNWTNGLLLEKQALGMKISPAADNYPLFARLMSGAPELYGLAAFPPEIPVEAFIQTLPSLMVIVVNINDILSIYKEEINGESANHISLLAGARGCSKGHAFHSIIHETIEAHEKILHILEPQKAALDAYKKFVCGYVDFHTGLDSRYRLDELTLPYLR